MKTAAGRVSRGELLGRFLFFCVYVQQTNSVHRAHNAAVTAVVGIAFSNLSPALGQKRGVQAKGLLPFRQYCGRFHSRYLTVARLGTLGVATPCPRCTGAGKKRTLYYEYCTTTVPFVVAMVKKAHLASLRSSTLSSVKLEVAT